MLIIETSSKHLERGSIPMGLYSIGNMLDESTLICEFHCEEKVVLSGVIEISQNSLIRIYKYHLSDKSESRGKYKTFVLPNKEFHNLYEHIIMDDETKYSLLDYLLRSEFINRQLEHHRFPCAPKGGCTMLLHGAPGMGKSSLCRALAQKYAIRVQKEMCLAEINCSHLISKFYGESLKIIADIFLNADAQTVFIFDEIESLVLRRQATLSKNEPLDTLRILNVLLSIMDQRRHIMLFTSNFKDELDPAFLDRCDIVFQVQALEPEKIYGLIVSITRNIVQCGIFAPETYVMLDYQTVSEACPVHQAGSVAVSKILYRISQKLVGYSCRKIQKLFWHCISEHTKNIYDLLQAVERALDRDAKKATHHN
ncbi:pachytene checkpoint protein 2 [Enteropsectra breve]|nr:pachytene checkpoint protein 2 [Enteropsectra breve]